MDPQFSLNFGVPACSIIQPNTCSVFKPCRPPASEPHLSSPSSGSQSDNAPGHIFHTLSHNNSLFVPNNEAILFISRSALTLVSAELQPSSDLAWSYLALDVNVPQRKNKSILKKKKIIIKIYIYIKSTVWMPFKIKCCLFFIPLTPSLDFWPFPSAFICTVMPPWIKLVRLI